MNPFFYVGASCSGFLNANPLLHWKCAPRLLWRYLPETLAAPCVAFRRVENSKPSTPGFVDHSCHQEIMIKTTWGRSEENVDISNFFSHSIIVVVLNVYLLCRVAMSPHVQPSVAAFPYSRRAIASRDWHNHNTVTEGWPSNNVGSFSTKAYTAMAYIGSCEAVMHLAEFEDIARFSVSTMVLLYQSNWTSMVPNSHRNLAKELHRNCLA